jgi:CRP-like cAMP-binding protein
VLSLDDVIARLKAELEPAMHTAARQAASREHERTREWLENRGLPKAARVAQHEAYNVLRKYGVISESGRSSNVHGDVGRSEYTAPEPHRLSPDEITDMAGVCVAMLETKGQSIELTLSEMSTEAGGFLLPEDAGHVREKANSLLSERNNREGK